MTQSEFGPFVLRLVNYYERRAPSEMTINEWLIDLNGIDGDRAFLSWASGTIKSRYPDGFPKGFALVIRRLWGEWLKDHPRKQEMTDNGCASPECENGLFYVRKYNPESRHADSQIFACRACQRSQNAYPRETVEGLVSRGFIFDSLTERRLFLVPCKPTYGFGQVGEILKQETQGW
jgi:hypothetical protein